MLSTKDINQKKEIIVNTIIVNSDLDIVFNLWKILTREDRLLFAERIIRHINKEIEDNK